VNSKSPGRLTENIIISLKPTIMKVKRIFFLLALLPVLFLITGCDNDDEDTPTPVPQEEMDIEEIIANSPVDPYTTALELIEQTGWTIENEVDIEAGDIQLMNYQRNLIGGDIAHYYFEVSVGADLHDKVGIHRLVKESGGSPIKTEKTFFFLHGDAKNFVGMMLPGQLSPNMADDFGMGVYLARNNVDVWGIDQAWTLVPQETMEFGFMQEWGLEKTAVDLRTGMAIARVARYLIGNELDRMIMSGYSSGVPTGFLACGMESQMEAGLRHIKGYVPIDYAILTDDPRFCRIFRSRSNDPTSQLRCRNLPVSHSLRAGRKPVSHRSGRGFAHTSGIYQFPGSHVLWRRPLYPQCYLPLLRRDLGGRLSLLACST
jgi:hypothetical protein